MKGDCGRTSVTLASYDQHSAQRNIRVYDVSADGSFTNGRIFGDEPGEHGSGVPDGMKVEVDGNLYVTGPRGIWVWSAKDQHIGTIVLPEQSANLAWGDSDYRALYITATTSVYRLKTKIKGHIPYLAH